MNAKKYRSRINLYKHSFNKIIGKHQRGASRYPFKNKLNGKWDLIRSETTKQFLYRHYLKVKQ